MKIICLCAAVLMLGTMIPVSGAMRVLNEKETIDKLQNASTEIQKQFIIGRISDLTIDDYEYSFCPINIIILFYEKSSHFTGSYLGHIKESGQRYYVSKDFFFKGILTPQFICGLFRYEAPETPQITFVKDDNAKTLLVASVDLPDVSWSDIANIGSGSCALPTSGYVAAGDMITNCYGQIELEYLPTNAMLCYYEFTPQVPNIMFFVAYPSHTINIGSVSPSDVRWSDFENTGIGVCTFPAKEYVEAGDQITDCYGMVQLHYIPTNTFMGTSDFAPLITFMVPVNGTTITVTSVYPTTVQWSSIWCEGGGSCVFPSKMYIEPGDVITDCSGRFTLRYIPTNEELGNFLFP